MDGELHFFVSSSISLYRFAPCFGINHFQLNSSGLLIAPRRPWNACMAAADRSVRHLHVHTLFDDKVGAPLTDRHHLSPFKMTEIAIYTPFMCGAGPKFRVCPTLS